MWARPDALGTLRRPSIHLIKAMKPVHYSLATQLLMLFVLATSCQREVNVDLNKGLSSQIQQIVPQPILDSLRKNGFIINEGLVPPQLSGNFYVDPDILQVSYGPQDPKRPGDLFSSYYYRFYAQDAAGKITYDYATEGKTDAGIGKGAFISGNGNKFTIFSEQSGVTSGIANKQLTVISGEITAGGIQGWQNSFVLTDKTNDVSNKLVPVGKGRIFKDGDGLAAKTSYFPQSVRPILVPVSDQIMSVPQAGAAFAAQ